MICQVTDCNDKATSVMKENYNVEVENLIQVVKTEKMLCTQHADVISNYTDSEVSIDAL